MDGCNNNNSNKSEEGTAESSSVSKKPGPPSRTHSMPLIQQVEGRSKLPQLRALNLAWDPLTGQSIGEEAELEDGADASQQLASVPTAVAAASEQEAGSRKASFWLGDHLGDLLEQIIPREEVLECFIDPFTGERQCSSCTTRPFSVSLFILISTLIAHNSRPLYYRQTSAHNYLKKSRAC